VSESDLALTISVFHVPLMWSSIAIGFTATVYTALGGLRSVVWTDCMQTVIIVSGIATIFIKVGYDSFVHPRHHLSFQEVRPYFLNASFDLTQDENIWANLIGLAAMGLFRTGIDQAAVQRYLAARTLKDARR
ncbi:sodium/solute symporter, putative, partial [Ixodes scapularis]